MIFKCSDCQPGHEPLQMTRGLRWTKLQDSPFLARHWLLPWVQWALQT